MSASSVASTSVISTQDTTDEVVDDNYVFRGFLAWRLWGWITIQTGAQIKSSLFTDGKKANAAYGRKTMWRQALKSAKHAHAKMPVVPASRRLQQLQPQTQA